MIALREYIKMEDKGNITACAVGLDVSRHTIHSWLIGRRTPNRIHALTLHKRSGIPLDAILGGGDQQMAAKKIVKKVAKKVTKKK